MSTRSLPERQPSRRRWRSGRAIAATLLGSQYALMLEYRAEILLWALSGLLPLLMGALWSASPAAASSGLSSAAFSRYFLAAFVVRQFTIVWVVYAFEEDNLLGRLSPYLLQPLALIWRYAAAHLAEQATRVPFVAAMVALVALVQPASVALPSPGHLLLGLLAMHLGFWINFLLQHAITMLCFWSERASALERLLFLPYLYLSGLLAPLVVYPPAVQAVALHSPFAAMLWLPARLLSGGPINAGAGFANALAWLLLLIPVNLVLWRAGVRRYSAMGA